MYFNLRLSYEVSLESWDWAESESKRIEVYMDNFVAKGQTKADRQTDRQTHNDNGNVTSWASDGASKTVLNIRAVRHCHIIKIGEIMKYSVMYEQ